MLENSSIEDMKLIVDRLTPVESHHAHGNGSADEEAVATETGFPNGQPALDDISNFFAGAIARVARDGTISDIYLPHVEMGAEKLKGLQNLNVRHVIPPDLVEKGEHCFDRALQSGRLEAFSHSVSTGAGTRNYEIWVAAVNPGEALVAIHDMTKRWQEEGKVLTLSRALLAMQSAAAAISSSLDLRHVLDTFTWEMSHMLRVSTCAVFDWDSENNRVTLAAVFHGQQPGKQLTLKKSCAGDEYPFRQLVVSERQPLQFNLNQATVDPHVRKYMAEHNVQSLLILPMIYQDKIVGLAEIMEAQTARSFTDQEISLALLLINQAASAIANARLHANLVDANSYLRESNEELDAFAHTVAHDLKGPLTHVIGFAEVLKQFQDAMGPEEIDEHLETIAESGHRMLGIIDGLLGLASIRHAQVKLKYLELGPMAAKVLSNLAPMIQERDCEIETQAEWPPCWGDPVLVEQVLTNLTSNAIKYGGRPPHIALGASTQSDGMVCLWVRDNGKGITPEQQERLFVPFERLSQSTEPGHGLGLSIVKRIVEKLGGRVGIESEPNKGSTFFFTLPGHVE